MSKEKKFYVQPATRIVPLRMTRHLLSGSNTRVIGIENYEEQKEENW